MKLLKYENHKLKNQFIFSLPASLEVCGRVCPSCYAIKAQRQYKNVMPYRERMYEQSKKYYFSNMIIDELKATTRYSRVVRIHESGEFYSQEYIKQWVHIAKELRNFTFYAFTKRLNDFDFSELIKLDNVIIIDSLKSGKLNYGDKYYIENLNQYICPATTENIKCDTIKCDYCMTKKAQENGVCFLKH